MYLLHETERRRIEQVMNRLYRQDRMDANAMRDAAHTLHGVLDALIPDKDSVTKQSD